ncbi:hypothetical protein [Noviherbaspirillum massiliense]|uniref:hypothetical protein n=1 Tax=Noviherbaspirillum massiliense TaxID=1465823 RepID=UPI00030E75BF|nr:hypothetical protein [Noviherbaspirillum massiliense]
MSASFLDPDNTPERDRKLGSGHGTSALGPSDTSDSGSDVQGGPGFLPDEMGIGLDRGTTSDPDGKRADRTAGPDVGDAALDSDSDSSGTGERASAGRDTTVEMGGDIDVDQIEAIDPDMDEDDQRADTAVPPPRQEGQIRQGQR